MKGITAILSTCMQFKYKKQNDFGIRKNKTENEKQQEKKVAKTTETKQQQKAPVNLTYLMFFLSSTHQSMFTYNFVHLR